jgi:predicted nucleic acid-binding protein
MSASAQADLTGCVIDASVAIKLFVIEDGSDQALALFERLAQEPAADFFVPDLFYAECANILWKYVRSYHYPLENARQDLADLLGLGLQSVPTVEIIRPAMELALAYDLPVNDACYLALAQALGLPLVSADAALARELSGGEIDVRLLTEIG